MSFLLDRKLEIFRMAAVLKHFSETASAMGMTQPNVTQQLAALENEFGTALFDRNGRKIELTEAGKTLLLECDRLFEDVSEIRRRVGNAARGVKHCRIGGTMTAGGYVLPELAAEFMKKYPEYNIGIRVGNTQTVSDALKKHALELALVEGPFDRNYFQSETLLSDELVPAAAPGILNRKFSLEKYLKSDGKFVLREYGSGTRYYFDLFLKKHNLPPPKPDSVLEVNNFDALKILVRGGFGITAISPLAIAEELKAGTLEKARFSEGRIFRNIDFLYPASERLGFAELFIHFCRTKMKNRAEGTPKFAFHGEKQL